MKSSRSKKKVAKPLPRGSAPMREAKLFQNGGSQAVRLPGEYRFEGETVYVKRWRGGVVLLPKDDPWQPLLDSLGNFSPDFMADRAQPGAQRRPALDDLFGER